MLKASHFLIYSVAATAFVCTLQYYRKRNRSSLRHSLDLVSECEIFEPGPIPVFCEYLELSIPLNIETSLVIKSQLLAAQEFHLHLETLSVSLPKENPHSLSPSIVLPEVVMAMTRSHVQHTVGTVFHSGSESEFPATPESNELASSPETVQALPPGCFNDPLNDIYEAKPEELDGKILPKVLIPSEMWAEAVDREVWHESFCIPAHMGGVLIGRLGKNVRELRNVWQAEFSLNTCPGKQNTLLFKLSCPLKYKDNVLRWLSQRFRMKPSKTTIGNPNLLKRNLPLGETTPVHVRSLYASKELFVTIPDEDYGNYLSMQSEMDKDYESTSNFRMHLCEPVTSGTVAVVPHSQGFARALIISVYGTWPKVVFYFLLDHGTFGVVELSKLKKIRAKYMRIPFQAIHVTWAHALPVFSDIPDLHLLRTFFNSGCTRAFAVRMETCCRSAAVFSEPYPVNGIMDTLVLACNSGLFAPATLMLYPKRQCWLNGSTIAYYPFTQSSIDYSSLVTFAMEEEELPAGSVVLDGTAVSKKLPDVKTFRAKNNTLQLSRSRRQRGTYTGHNLSKNAKENHYDNQPNNSENQVFKSLSDGVSCKDDFFRAPLRSQNAKSASVNNFKNFGRGRGYEIK